MKLIAGLGNPGRRYESTRHNVGWWLLDRIALLWNFESWKRDLDAAVTSKRLRGGLVRLLKPLTYMNLSGASLRPYLRRPTFDVASDLLVVVDDVALPLGSFRLRAHGSAGGHNGLRSIEQAVGTTAYARLRIGIRPLHDEQQTLTNFVLSPMSRTEKEVLNHLGPRLDEAVESWIFEGIGPAMNKFNRKTPPPE